MHHITTTSQTVKQAVLTCKDGHRMKRVTKKIEEKEGRENQELTSDWLKAGLNSTFSRNSMEYFLLVD